MTKKSLKIIGFLLLTAAIGIGLMNILRFKRADGSLPMEYFYHERKNSIDVLCIGSSHMFCNISPKTFWEDFGIASYNLGGTVQPIWNSYFYIKEAIKTQKPRAVILDIYTTSDIEKYLRSYHIINNTFGIAPSWNRIEAIWKSSEKRDRINYWLAYPTYHQRYMEISKEDFQPLYITKNSQNDKSNLDSKGFLLFTHTVPQTAPKIPAVIPPHPLHEKPASYLSKIIQLCQQEQIPLLLVVTPYAGDTPVDESYYAKVQAIAKEHNIPFLNFNHFYNEIGFDFSRDAVDVHHCNHRGSEKVTRYLGKYLKEQYDLPDHRGEADYASYDKMCRVLQWKIDNQTTSDLKTLPALLDHLATQKERYLFAVGVQGNYQALLNNPSLCSKFTALGIPLKQAHQNDIWVLDAGHQCFHAGQTASIDWHMPIKDGFIYIRRPAPNAPLECNLNRELETFVPNGLSIVVYDKEMDYIVVRAGFAVENNTIKEKQALQAVPTR